MLLYVQGSPKENHPVQSAGQDIHGNMVGTKPFNVKKFNDVLKCWKQDKEMGISQCAHGHWLLPLFMLF